MLKQSPKYGETVEHWEREFGWTEKQDLRCPEAAIEKNTSISED